MTKCEMTGRPCDEKGCSLSVNDCKLKREAKPDVTQDSEVSEKILPPEVSEKRT